MLALVTGLEASRNRQEMTKKGREKLAGTPGDLRRLDCPAARDAAPPAGLLPQKNSTLVS